MNPKISVIIPAHNEEDVIGRCVKSVISNDYKNKEIIVVNDGSNDNTEKIVQDLTKKHNIKIVNFKQGHSAAFARNHGAEKAKGEILIFLDADCTINNKFLEEIAKKSETVDAFLTICLPIKEAFMSKVLVGFLGPSIKSKLRDGSIYDINNSELAGSMFFCITKKAFDKIKGYDENTFYYEDEAFAKKFYKNGFKSVLVKNAIQYFELPSTFEEFTRQCKWIGKGTNTIKNKKQKNKKKFFWIIKALFFISPLFFIFNLKIFLITLFFTGFVGYLSLLNRNKKIFLSFLTLPFLYIKTFLVTFNIIRFWK